MNFSFLHLVFSALALKLAGAGVITEICSDCGSKKVTINKVTMVGCDQEVDDECSAYSGTAVSGTITWHTNQNITKLLSAQGQNRGDKVAAGLPCPRRVPIAW